MHKRLNPGKKILVLRDDFQSRFQPSRSSQNEHVKLGKENLFFSRGSVKDRVKSKKPSGRHEKSANFAALLLRSPE